MTYLLLRGKKVRIQGRNHGFHQYLPAFSGGCYHSFHLSSVRAKGLFAEDVFPRTEAADGELSMGVVWGADIDSVDFLTRQHLVYVAETQWYIVREGEGVSPRHCTRTDGFCAEAGFVSGAFEHPVSDSACADKSEIHIA